MVETNWVAVAVGILTVTALTMISTVVEPLALLGGVAASIAGGFAAGYYAHSGRNNGAWHGFLSGSIGGIVLVGLLVAFGAAVSIVELSLGGIFATVGIAVAALVVIAVAAIPATLAGYLGGLVHGRGGMEAEPGRPAA